MNKMIKKNIVKEGKELNLIGGKNERDAKVH